MDIRTHFASQKIKKKHTQNYLYSEWIVEVIFVCKRHNTTSYADSFSFKSGIILNYQTCPKFKKKIIVFTSSAFRFLEIFVFLYIRSRLPFFFVSHPFFCVCLHHCRFYDFCRMKGVKLFFFTCAWIELRAEKPTGFQYLIFLSFFVFFFLFSEIVANTDNGSIHSLMVFLFFSFIFTMTRNTKKENWLWTFAKTEKIDVPKHTIINYQKNDVDLMWFLFFIFRITVSCFSFSFCVRVFAL